MLSQETNWQRSFDDLSAHQLYSVCAGLGSGADCFNELGATEVQGCPIVRCVAGLQTASDYLVINCSSIVLAVIVWTSCCVYKTEPVIEPFEPSV
jgi:hypothetical protein